MNLDILKDLNSEQKKAALETSGPMIILAGAGSGKTRVITYKVVYLITQNVNPLNILCVTFTNKAGNEMKERVERFLLKLNIKKGSPTISTFHSLCAKILRVEAPHVGLSRNFIIYDQQEQIDAIKEVMKKMQINPKDYKPSSVLAAISSAKNELISSDEYVLFARGSFQKVVS
ncbi:UvrD-helicase domain-containing protein, partial [Patescibacteria group bacterium]|nr:UvrD-helicase domain-containing protein [Patescibacteria group bacterium]